jgi:hypothetical protein
MLQQIRSKISSYKQQDLLKHHFREESFITLENVLDMFSQQGLHCYYCKGEVYILYDVAREMKQWSVDRIDNHQGHNQGNIRIACLECNLSKRRRNDEAFRITKQLVIVKEGAVLVKEGGAFVSEGSKDEDDAAT